MAAREGELNLEALQRLQEASAPQAAKTPAAYFGELHRQFQAAAGKHPVSRYFKIGPHRTRFVFACPELADSLAPPFEHLEIEAVAGPDLTIAFWDSQLSGIPLQPPRWAAVQGCRLSLHGDGTFVQYDFGTEILHSYSAKDRLGIFWVKDATKTFFAEKVCPIRSIFHWLCQGSSLQLIHGGAVGDENGGAILVGRGGSGKSTSCTTSLLSDLFFLADDYCLIDTEQARVFSLYASSKINPDMLPQFPHLSESRIDPSEGEGEKPSFLLGQSYRERLKAELPLKAILIPRLKGGLETQVSPASAMQGLHALAPSTLFQSTGLGDDSFKKMAALSRRIPSFFLELGTDLRGVPRAIGALLKSL